MNASRTVIIQGSVLEVRGVKRGPCQQRGGGKRQTQHGHDSRLAKRMEKDLLKCREPDAVIWLTYPDIHGPASVKAHVNSIVKKLEKRLCRSLATVAKLETQMRLSPEIALLVWGAAEREIAELDVSALWAATIKHTGEVRMRIEKVQNWCELASYVSKRVTVEETGVFVGHERSTFILSKEHKTAISGSFTPIPDTLYLSSSKERFRKVLSEWLGYTGRYHWKHRGKEIPRHRRVVAQIDGAEADQLRLEVNRRRKNHFVGPHQGFSLCGAALANIDLSIMLAPPRVPATLHFGDVRPSIYETEMPLDWAVYHPTPDSCIGTGTTPSPAVSRVSQHFVGTLHQPPPQIPQVQYPLHSVNLKSEEIFTSVRGNMEQITIHIGSGQDISFSFKSQVQVIAGQDKDYALSYQLFSNTPRGFPLRCETG